MPISGDQEREELPHSTIWLIDSASHTVRVQNDVRLHAQTFHVESVMT